MLAATASPVALFALGCFLYGHIGAKKIKLLIAAVCVKLALDPLLAYIISNKLTSDSSVVHTTMLMAAMPTAVTAFVLAKTYKLNTAFVANAMLASTVLSVATLSLFVQFVF
jgi:predicted permease